MVCVPVLRCLRASSATLQLPPARLRWPGPADGPAVARAAGAARAVTAVVTRAVAAPRAVVVRRAAAAGAGAAEAADTGQLVRVTGCPAGELPPGIFLLGQAARTR